MTLNKCGFSDLKILKIREHISREDYAQGERPKRAESENVDNRHITQPSNTLSVVIKPERNNDLTEKKVTLPSPRNYDWKKVKLETEKVNTILKNIPKDNITK